jgi:hypothetical protein
VDDPSIRVALASLYSTVNYTYGHHDQHTSPSPWFTPCHRQPLPSGLHPAPCLRPYTLYLFYTYTRCFAPPVGSQQTYVQSSRFYSASGVEPRVTWEPAAFYVVECQDATSDFVFQVCWILAYLGRSASSAKTNINRRNESDCEIRESDGTNRNKQKDK